MAQMDLSVLIRIHLHPQGGKTKVLSFDQDVLRSRCTVEAPFFREADAILLADDDDRSRRLARRAGVDLTRLMEALSGGAAASPVLTMKGSKMINGDYTASSRVLIHLKDQHNAQEMARALGADIPACDLSTLLLEKLADMGRGNEDVAAVIDLFQSKVDLRRLWNGNL